MMHSSPQISRQDVLALTSAGLDFYRFIIPSLRVNGHKCKPVCNPFYPDTNPSLSIFYSDRQWLFNDFGDPAFKGDVFTFAGHYYNLNPDSQFPEILARMNHDLSLNNPSVASSTPLKVTAKSPLASINKSPSSIFQPSVKLRKNLLDFEVQYWAKYGIPEELLARFNVCPVDVFQPISGLMLSSGPGNPVFAYAIHDGNFKIYQPHNPRYKFQWIGKRPDSWYFGYEQLPSSGNLVFITGGEKDVLTLASLGLPAITLNSETAILPEDLNNELAARFENIVVLYDADETGMNQSEKLGRSFGLTRWLLPQWLVEKGGKDISDYIALGGDIGKDEIFAETFEKEDPVLPVDGPVTAVLEKLTSVARITHVRSANKRLSDAATLPPIQKLLDIFFHSGELAILFADTGVGKSVFAVSAANAIASGTSFMGLSNEAPAQTVLYYDFELSDKQFQKRYSDDSGNMFAFSPNLYVVNLNYDDMINLQTGLDFDEILYLNIERDIIEKQAGIVVIDNLTFLKTQPMQEQDTALAVMKKLILLKRKYNLSMLVLAHTPKILSTSPLNINHLQGSKHLANFSDSVFCLGYSATDSSMRYLKQVKPSRSAELIYDTENVMVCEIRKEGRLLTFLFSNYDTEINHLLKREEANTELKERARQLRAEGNTLQQIAAQIGKSKSTVERWLKSPAST